MNTSNKITIIGGGPAGIACAYYSHKCNINFILFESSHSFGGNSRTIKYRDFYFDTGAHRLHDKDIETTILIKNILGKKLKKIHVPSQIFRNNQFIDFPLSPVGLFKFLGFRSFIKESVGILFRSIFIFKKPQNFHDFAIFRFGSKISELFLLEYSRKLWGVNTKKLSISVSGNRLKGLSIYMIIVEYFFGKKIKTQHLDGSFYYPDFGIGSIFDGMVKLCNKSKFNRNSRVTSINHSNNKIDSIIINGKTTIMINELISTMPINTLLANLNPLPPSQILEIANEIKFRNIILICFFLNKNSINQNGSMYFPSNEYSFTRVYEPKNRCSKMSPTNKTSLIVEVPCQPSDEIWNNQSQLIVDVKNDLVNIGFFEEDDIIDLYIHKINHAYPILAIGFEDKINSILNYLSRFKNLHLSGRNGLFQYSHIHDHMKNARELFSQIV